MVRIPLMKRWTLLLFGCLLPVLGQAAPSCTGSGSAMVCTVAATNTQQDVVDAINAIYPGGKVVVGPGVVLITSTIFTGSKSYTLQGGTTCDSTTGVCNDVTTFQDNIQGRAAATGVSNIPVTPPLTINTPLGETFTLRGITFTKGNDRLGSGDDDGQVTIFGGGASGMSHAIRITQCHFLPDGKQARQLQIRSGCWGVADHNVFNNSGQQVFDVRMTNWPYPSPPPATPSPTPYPTPAYGDGSWEQPSNFGTAEFFVLEDNYINDAIVTQVHTDGSTTDVTGYSDATEGGRFVFRFNHCINFKNTTHGTTGNRFRGVRAIEVYGNDFRLAKFNSVSNHNVSFSSGTGMVFDNSNITDFLPGSTTTHYVAQTGIDMQAYLMFAGSAAWGGASGFGPWTVNDSTTGTNLTMPNQRGVGNFSYSPTDGIYASGVVTAATNPGTFNGPQTLTVKKDDGVTSPRWTTDQFAGFVLTKLSGDKADYPCDPQTPTPPYPASRVCSFSNIRDTVNDIDTISAGSYTDGDQQCCWKANDLFKIARPLVLLDMPGRGQCHDHIQNYTPLNTTKGYGGTAPQATSTGSVTNGLAWPEQDLEPIYEWNNAVRPTATATPSSYVHNAPNGSNVGYLNANVDYYNFDPATTSSTVAQTSGVRRGTMANRPPASTSAPGVAYWATDSPGSDWNQANNGSGATQDGRLYILSPSHVWVNAYTPLTYPHYLVGTTPTIVSLAAQFTANSSTNQTFQVQTQNFVNPPPTFSKTVTSVPAGATAGQLPNGVSFSSGGLFSGFATGAVAGEYHITIQATVFVPTQSDTQDFVLTIISPNGAPVIDSFNSPANGSTWPYNGNVPIDVNAHDDVAVANVKFFIDSNATPLATVSTPPYTTTWNPGSTVPISSGSHVIKATATDGDGLTGNGTVTVTVAAAPTPAVTPTPPQIRVSQ